MTAIRLALASDSEAVIERHADRPRLLIVGIDKALGQTADEAVSYMQVNFLVGGDVKTKRDGTPPLASRSSQLSQSPLTDREDALTHYFGFPARVRHAKTVAGDGTTVITPKKAKHLWIPVGDNLTPSGQMRISPSAAFEMRGKRGGRLLSIFTSAAGNLVAFLRDAAGGSYKRGKNKGRLRGKLLFVLKKSVTVKGIDALGRTAEAIRPRGLELLGIAVNSLDEGRAS